MKNPKAECVCHSRVDDAFCKQHSRPMANGGSGDEYCMLISSHENQINVHVDRVKQIGTLNTGMKPIKSKQVKNAGDKKIE